MRMRRGFYAFGAVAAALGLALLLVWGLQIAAPVAAAGAETLKNDSWAPGQPLAFMNGFSSGDIAASRLVPSDTSEVQVTSVLFMFGPAPGTHAITMTIWEDTGGTVAPGAVLFSDSYQVTASSDAIQVIDLSAENVTVSGTFRVGIEFTHDGAPSVGYDDDGITPDRNFIYWGDWYTASTFGVPGDWIIRATVEGVDDTPPEVLSTLPISGAVDVALAAPVVITFSESIDTGTFTYTVAPDPGGWSDARHLCILYDLHGHRRRRRRPGRQPPPRRAIRLAL
jgi:hypothetical protein